ncbi:protein lifeguard 3 isoform X2 [Amia ocellicauda]|uniref:protein lifeguard 3 isoform X2 n=1 Tax=Amia ocellicauda TaxID=2972642 RepID=UPI003464E60B
MSHPHIPPSYDESRNPLYAPHHGEPPAYGFEGQPQPGMYPGQPSMYPGQPSMYPGQPSMYPGQPSMYPGQPSMYPGQPNMYSGQPGMFPGQPGMFPGQPGPQYGPGHPAPGMPPMMPPVIPPMVPTSPLNQGDTEGFTSQSWDDKTVRHAFIRKVYLILAAQLLVTVTFVAVFTFCSPVRLFVSRNSYIYWISYGFFTVTYLVLVCCQGPRRRFPWNIILLVIFTLAMSYMTGTISSYYDTKAVFLALGITAIVCIIVTIFCFQTKVDFTSCGGLFCVLGIVVMVTGIITAIVLSFKYIPWLHMLYAAIGAIVYTLFLAYHTQLLIGNRKHSISPEEYVYGALSLYVDIIQIFTFLLQLIGSSR